uniref:Uncharacterized protein n=1 Tax=Strigamia maritima TaxID=126957 RepID=T1ILZ5_STRMM
MASYLLLVFLIAFAAAEPLAEICLKLKLAMEECIKESGRDGFRLCLLRKYELDKHSQDDLYGGYRDRLTLGIEEEAKRDELHRLLESCERAKDVIFCGIEKLAHGGLQQHSFYGLKPNVEVVKTADNNIKARSNREFARS